MRSRMCLIKANNNIDSYKFMIIYVGLEIKLVTFDIPYFDIQ